jgi:NAD(P)-dependent dehydrogenase (short-subunit alcohol dehydrogenase family)
VIENKLTKGEKYMSGRLDGKVAVVTGSGSGIGRAIAILFAKEGAKVVVTCRTIRSGEETVDSIKKLGNEAIFVKADVSRAEDMKDLIKAATDHYGGLTVLCNNAGIDEKGTPIAKVPEESFDRIMATNLRGVFLGMKYAIPEMLKAGGGSIINISSMAADVGVRGHAPYCASKAGIVSLSRVAALEYASRNIRVNALSPGPVVTPLQLAALDAEYLKAYLTAIPQGRLGEPEEVANVALFLACDESSLITGQAIVADGGIEADSHIIEPAKD